MIEVVKLAIVSSNQKLVYFFKFKVTNKAIIKGVSYIFCSNIRAIYV